MRRERSGQRQPLLTAPIRQLSGTYPLEDWSYPIKVVVAAALRAAWERIVSQVELDGGSLVEEQENYLTARLQSALNDIQGEPGHPTGFSGSIFQDVTRNENTTNFDSRSLEKSPDLTFRLISTTPGIERHLRALHVECKIVDPAHPVRLYCTQGIHRFICGDYAWAMLSGMMVGYAHPSFTIPEKLSPYLKASSTQSSDAHIRSLPQLKPEFHGDPPVYESRHERAWRYPHSGISPGEIAILHLWLPLPS